MPAGSTSTLLFRELLSKLQIGTLQDKIFSLRGLNSIVAVNEHTSIRLLKTKDFAHIVFQLCRQPDSPKLRTQALKFLKHLASGTVCRKLLLSRGALNDLADLVIHEFGAHGEEFLIAASEYLLELLQYDSNLSGYELTDRTREKVQRTVSFLRENSNAQVRRIMSRLDNADGRAAYAGLLTQEATGVSLHDRVATSPSPNVLQISSRVNLGMAAKKGRGGAGSFSDSLTDPDLSFNRRLKNLKSTLGSKEGKFKALPAQSEAESEEVVEVEVGQGLGGSEDSMASISDDTTMDTTADTEANEREPEGGALGDAESRRGPEVAPEAQSTSQESEEGDEGGADGDGGGTDEGQGRGIEDEIVDSRASTSSSEGQGDSEDNGAAATAKGSVSFLVHIKRGALMQKFFLAWMRVAQNELLMRQQIKTMRRLFNYNNRNRRLQESFYAWKFNTRQKVVLALCLNKWLSMRLVNCFVSWDSVARELRRNNRVCLAYHRNRMHRLMGRSFSEWRCMMNAKIFSNHRDMKAKFLYLEDEVEDLKHCKAEATRFRDHLYNVLSEVSEIGVNLLKVENGGEALIDCCARVENILRLNSAYVPQEALDSAMASIDWEAISPKPKDKPAPKAEEGKE